MLNGVTGDQQVSVFVGQNDGHFGLVRVLEFKHLADKRQSAHRVEEAIDHNPRLLPFDTGGRQHVHIGIAVDVKSVVHGVKVAETDEASRPAELLELCEPVVIETHSIDERQCVVIVVIANNCTGAFERACTTFSQSATAPIMLRPNDIIGDIDDHPSTIHTSSTICVRLVRKAVARATRSKAARLRSCKKPQRSAHLPKWFCLTKDSRKFVLVVNLFDFSSLLAVAARRFASSCHSRSLSLHSWT